MPVDCARASPLGNVARETCFGAKHKFDKMPPMNEISDFDAGFICGLVTGEGSFTGDRRQPALAIKLHQDDPEPLLFMQRVLGGKIYGPYCQAGRRYYFWRLVGRALHTPLPLFDERLPKSRKRDQFIAWMDKYRPRQKLEASRELAFAETQTD